MKNKEEVLAKALEIGNAVNLNIKTFNKRELFFYSIHTCLREVAYIGELYNNRKGIISEIDNIVKTGLQFGAIDDLCSSRGIQSPNISRLMGGVSISTLGFIAAYVWILDDVDISVDPLDPNHPFLASTGSTIEDDRVEYLEKITNAYGISLTPENSSVVENILQTLMNSVRIGIGFGVSKFQCSSN